MKTKFALINNNRTEATKGAKGICPFCGSAMIAKCGDYKIHHWAHKGILNCDSWGESETEWHRAWKDNFNLDWQEIILTDEITGEKHRADVRTEHGLFIEFQHSHLDSIERIKREKFYKNMIWIVDGTRLKRDYPRFLKAKECFRSTSEKGVYSVDFPDECFPNAWLNSSVPVIFDYKGIESTINPNDWRSYLYYLLPKSNMRESLVIMLTRESFINNIINGKWFSQQKEPDKQIEEPQIKNIPIRTQRQSQYIYHKGRFVKRRRF